MMFKQVALLIGLAVVVPSAGQAADTSMPNKPQAAPGKMMQDPAMKQKCAEMMKRNGKGDMGDMMKKSEGGEEKMAADMKGCSMMKKDSAASKAVPKSKKPKSPAAADPADHAGHHPT